MAISLVKRELDERLARTWRWIGKRTGSKVRAELPPLPLQLLSLDHLARHARDLSADQRLDRRSKYNMLLARLDDNALALDDAYNVVANSAARESGLTPAGEWLLDNFHLLKEQMAMVERHLPQSYNRQLPRLLDGPYQDLPRVYALAVELITHVDGRSEQIGIERFISAFQERSALSSGELWAFPIMLRIALIELVRRVAERVAAARVERDWAASWAERFRETVERTPSDVVMVLADLARLDLRLSDTFVAELTHRVHSSGHANLVLNEWLEQRLAPHGRSIALAIAADGQAQVGYQMSISNAICSLRGLSNIDWRGFVERQSMVERILLEDPSGFYSQMDFTTRDRYRHQIEMISRRSQREEPDIAALTVATARAAEAGLARHVGWWLVGGGRRSLWRIAGARRTFHELLLDILLAVPLFWYLGLAAAIAIVAGVGAEALLLSEVPSWLRLMIAGLAGLAAWGPAIAGVDWLVTQVIPTRSLSRLDLRNGLTAANRTTVAVPVMLTSDAVVDELIGKAEVRYLCNRDPDLHFVLLSDFADAAHATLPGDHALVERAAQAIATLNRRHGANDVEGPFLLLHRPRQYNAQQGVWMGRERKRGKLEDLNHAILDGDLSPFSRVSGAPGQLAGVRYVIVLDADTVLPHRAAAALVGAIAHPLNAPRFDHQLGRVVEGHGVIQPRLGSSLPASQRTWMAQLASGDVGINPYTHAVSDVYQDLFAEGSFFGKGIYDVAVVELALGKRLPANRILSHDLLEGCYLRSGLDSETVVYEDQPSYVLTDSLRRHRWIRGDWQIARWLFANPPSMMGRADNSLTALSRWKIFDNLRRSLSPLIWFLLLAVIAILPDHEAMLGAALGMLALPVLLPWLVGAMRPLEHIGLRGHLRRSWRIGVRGAAIWCVELSLLPFTVVNQLDAIIRACWRLAVSKRYLLEWTTSSEMEMRRPCDLHRCIKALLPASLLTLGVIAVALVNNPAGVDWFGPMLALWLVAPVVVWQISSPLSDGRTDIPGQMRSQLRRLALRTWKFFTVYVGVESHWLPPDNVQENPDVLVAQRTSPTNIGLALLANLGARDFAMLSTSAMLERCRQTLDSMDRLERFRGHFYNWYDTSTLQPLHPLYVSTVDSGNLIGHLLVLRSGLAELSAQPVVPSSLGETLIDLSAMAAETGDGGADNLLTRLANDASASINDLAALRPKLVGLRDAARIVAGTRPEIGWSTTIADLAEAWISEIEAAVPWISLRAPPDGVDGQSMVPGLLRGNPTFADITEAGRSLAANPVDTAVTWSGRLEEAVTQGARHVAQLLVTADHLFRRCGVHARPELDFLYDGQCKLFALGYHVTDRRRDSTHYDLLASEARLISYIAVATGRVEAEHWFALGRTVTGSAGRSCLVSWSGSMFEYLMPLLVMPTYEGTLLDVSNHASVQAQIDYGSQRGVPWGISESGFNLTDQAGNYQYRAFGVPGLGLKRGLAKDLVIAPYATVMSAMVEPYAAGMNLLELEKHGAAGEFGFYEAIDFTAARLPRGQTHAIVRQYMVHHQGMAFLALVRLLLDCPMQRRFLADPELKAGELLLHEQVPDFSEPLRPNEDEAANPQRETGDEGTLRVLTNPCPAIPEVHLLSNGHYHVMVTAGGSGYSRCGDLAVTRWREDPTVESYGLFCYLRDCELGSWWSTTYQPARISGRGNEAVFTLALAEFRRREYGIESHVEMAVSPEDNIEVRRVRLTNVSRRQRTIELTTFSEVVIAASRKDEAHPAFSNLFVRTEAIDDGSALLATRRARSPDERPSWVFHLVQVHDVSDALTSFTTDRSAFIGRGRGVECPIAIERGGPLGGESGYVLDPALAIRRTMVIAPDETVVIDVVMGLCPDRSSAVAMVEKYRDRPIADRVFGSAWSHANIRLAHLGISTAEAQLFNRLAGAVLLPTGHRRSASTLLIRNRRGQSGLWSFGISGDLPIVVLRCSDPDHLNLTKGLVQAHSWWRSRGLIADLVLLIDHPIAYRQELRDAVTALVANGPTASTIDRPGGVFIRRDDQMSDEDRLLLLTVAVAVFQDGAGTLGDQTDRRGRVKIPTDRLSALPSRSRTGGVDRKRTDLILGNGIGGFTKDGREYVMLLHPGSATPAPWSNVIANPHFGTLVTESGGGYTWLENCHEFRLTPWYNEAVGDNSGQALYIRDDTSGESWSPTPGPRRGAGTYEVRHGFGYSIFEHEGSEIATELSVYVAIDAPVRFEVLRIRNTSRRTRRISVLGCSELVLGEQRSRSMLHLVTDVDATTGLLTARNSFHPDMPDRIAFMHVQGQNRTYTGDRAEFIGVGSDLGDPAALGQAVLSGRIGGGLDPCFAFMSSLELAPGEQQEVIILFGAARDQEDLQILLRRFGGSHGARQALEEVWERWKRATGTVRVSTPDPYFDVIVNGWMIYQILSARLWARTGFYQSGGAYGFRDQLQDVMALVHADPAEARQHLLVAARHQFREGDVQHWWHPPSGRGVRTRCSDDLLWLPLAVARYVKVTGDTGVLSESCIFIEGRGVAHDEEAYYDLPQPSAESATLYAHCVRALHRAMRYGEHGLPLMGCGDWNDGMNLVGNGGKGESVWLGFFLYEVLRHFEPLAIAQKDAATAGLCQAEMRQLRTALESQAWDGGWYKRAWFDDGRPLGSQSSPECSIDALPQCWAVLSAAGEETRCRTAMDAVDRRLVRRGDGLVALFDPPFDRSDLEPGYIKGYAPGVRENGGQYTHAAVWTAMAFAALGDRKRAWEVFDLLNPVHHGDSRQASARYRVEPYVLAADVYGVAPSTGRGGWTWYTGSAGWFYRLAIESLLGLERVGLTLRINPLPRPGWPGYRISYQFGGTTYVFSVSGEGRVVEVRQDGAILADGSITLVDDGRERQIMVRLDGR